MEMLSQCWCYIRKKTPKKKQYLLWLTCLVEEQAGTTVQFGLVVAVGLRGWLCVASCARLSYSPYVLRVMSTHA